MIPRPMDVSSSEELIRMRTNALCTGPESIHKPYYASREVNLDTAVLQLNNQISLVFSHVLCSTS
jgi:hypothetical protein